jgi:hypothetical protein
LTQTPGSEAGPAGGPTNSVGGAQLIPELIDSRGETQTEPIPVVLQVRPSGQAGAVGPVVHVWTQNAPVDWGAQTIPVGHPVPASTLQGAVQAAPGKSAFWVQDSPVAQAAAHKLVFPASDVLPLFVQATAASTGARQRVRTAWAIRIVDAPLHSPRATRLRR